MLRARCEGLEALLAKRAAAAAEQAAALEGAKAEAAGLRGATEELRARTAEAGTAAAEARARREAAATKGRRQLELSQQEHEAAVRGIKAQFAAQLGQVRAARGWALQGVCTHRYRCRRQLRSSTIAPEGR